MLKMAHYYRNANQNCNDISPHTNQKSNHQKSTNSKCWRRCGEKCTLLQRCWECKLIEALWKTIWRLLKKKKKPRNKTTFQVISITSVTQSCPTFFDPMNRSTPGLPVHQQLPKSTQTHVHLGGDAIHYLILCLPLLLLSTIFPSIRVFSNESSLCIRWPKYWSFSFNIRPSYEYSGLVSFRMDWLDLLAV